MAIRVKLMILRWVGRVVFASYYKSYNEYRWCYLKATYLNGDIETDLVTDGGAIPTSDSTLLNEAFAKMNECQHIIKLLEKWL